MVASTPSMSVSSNKKRKMSAIQVDEHDSVKKKTTDVGLHSLLATKNNSNPFDTLPEGILSDRILPFVGNYLAHAFFPITYYSIDTSSMFLTYAQSSVLKVIDDITNEKGVRSLTESERKPIMKDIFKR